MKSMLSRFIACGLVLGLSFGSTGLASWRTSFMDVVDEYNVPNIIVQELENLVNDSVFKECANDVLRRYTDRTSYCHDLVAAAQQICGYATCALDRFFEFRDKHDTEELLYTVTIELGQSGCQEMVFGQRVTIEDILQRALSIAHENSENRDSEYELTFSSYGSGNSYWHLYL